MKTNMRVLAVALFLAAAFAARAAPPSPGSRGNVRLLSAWGVLDPGGITGVGVGGRATVPLVPQGVLHSPRVRDDFTLELGADFVHYSDRVGYAPYYVDYSFNGILPVGGVAWNFWFTPELALYPKIDVGFLFGWYSGWNPDPAWHYDRHDFGGPFVEGAIGVIYRLPSLALRAEAGSGFLRLGVGFPF